MLCIGMLITTAAEVFADINHFEDGHEIEVFDDYGISLEIPNGWYVLPLEDMFALAPDETGDVVYLLSIVEYEDRHNLLDDLFLKTATDSGFAGMTGEDQKGKSKIMTLSNGNNAAVALYYIDVETKDTYMMASTFCGSQMIMLGFKSPLDKYEEEYLSDLDYILSSAEEI